jgi:mycofactocin precursor
VPKIISAEGVRMSENETTAGTEEVLTEELLVEEVSIDGMCGVY